ncbi:MAG: response regulator transcription factor [Roseiflexaceae bacterium]
MGLDPKPITILIVEDHALVRESIFYALGAYPGIQPVAMAASGEAALQVLREQRGQIDVVLMDIDMPGLDGIKTTGRIRQEWPKCQVIMLTSFERFVGQAAQIGANGYLLKGVTPSELVEAIRHVAQGRAYYHQDIQPRLLATLRDPLEPLNERDMLILKDLAEGLSNAKIALKHDWAESTVREYVGVLLRKLEADNRTQAVSIAFRAGLLK